MNISEHPKTSSGINSNIAANLSARVDKKPSDLLIAKSPATDVGRQLWQAGISVSEDSKSSRSKNELQQIIKQINSVEFKPQNRTLESLIVVEPAGTAESNEALSNTDVPEGTKSEKPETMPQRGQITKQTLQIFEQLSQQPQQIKNPLELAEILFRSNQLKEAAKCYQEALKLMTANENGRHEDKAWILFQIGNCLQKDDPPTAMQMYKQLIVECPDSPWVDLAEAKSRLIDWYLKEKPNTLINERKL
ncbi:MAG: tetratricopeptide repeat protein [Sedimentisphaerales bacterium]